MTPKRKATPENKNVAESARIKGRPHPTAVIDLGRSSPESETVSAACSTDVGGPVNVKRRLPLADAIDLYRSSTTSNGSPSTSDPAVVRWSVFLPDRSPALDPSRSLSPSSRGSPSPGPRTSPAPSTRLSSRESTPSPELLRQPTPTPQPSPASSRSTSLSPSPESESHPSPSCSSSRIKNHPSPREPSPVPSSSILSSSASPPRKTPTSPDAPFSSPRYSTPSRSQPRSLPPKPAPAAPGTSSPAAATYTYHVHIINTNYNRGSSETTEHCGDFTTPEDANKCATGALLRRWGVPRTFFDIYKAGMDRVGLVWVKATIGQHAMHCERVARRKCE